MRFSHRHGWHSFLLIAAVILLAGSARSGAALIVTDFTTHTETFDSFAGTSPTIPSNWTTGGSTDFRGTLTSGSSSYVTSNGWYALNDDGSTSDIAFGARVNSGNTFTLTIALTNNTGQQLDGFTIGYNMEQYTFANAGGNTLSLRVSTDNVTFDQTGLAGDITSSPFNMSGSANTVYDDPVITARSATYTGAILNGETLYFQFAFTSTGSGNRPHYGIDDAAFTAIVPEPTSAVLAMGGLCLLATARYRRRAGR